MKYPGSRIYAPVENIKDARIIYVARGLTRVYSGDAVRGSTHRAWMGQTALDTVSDTISGCETVTFLPRKHRFTVCIAV